VRLAWAVDFTFALDGAEDRDAGTEDPGTGPVAPAENAA
jgi:hypothetical protein